MIRIYYGPVLLCISALWILVRCMVNLYQDRFFWKRELQLLLVYICIVVVTRFTFFPFSRVDGQIQPLLLVYLCILVVTRFTFFPFSRMDGQIQPLLLDPENIFPPRINLIPFVYLFDYPVFREAVRNLIGNAAMFIPLGIVWPSVFRKLDSHGKVIAAGVGYSLLIELVQLPFFDRVSDIDDLILNSLGFLLGYGIYLLVKAEKRSYKRRKGRK